VLTTQSKLRGTTRSRVDRDRSNVGPNVDDDPADALDIDTFWNHDDGRADERQFWHEDRTDEPDDDWTSGQADDPADRRGVPRLLRRLVPGLSAILLLALLVGTSQSGADDAGAAVDPDSGYPWCEDPASDFLGDPVGDGYGWENNQSCRVRPERKPGDDQPAEIDPNSGYPFCKDPASDFLGDPVGDGYGWENGQSCRVRPGQEGSRPQPSPPTTRPGVGPPTTSRPQPATAAEQPSDEAAGPDQPATPGRPPTGRRPRPPAEAPTAPAPAGSPAAPAPAAPAPAAPAPAPGSPTDPAPAAPTPAPSPGTPAAPADPAPGPNPPAGTPSTPPPSGGPTTGPDASVFDPIRNDQAKFSRFANVPSAQLDLTALTEPAPRPDNGTVGDGQFRAACEYSHFGYDDPIVFPGQPGRAHLHMFFGNTYVDANTTTNSLVNSGGGTCNGFELNRSGYWTPALLDGKGNVIVPDSIILYYKTKVPSVIQEMPQGLKIIAGNGSHTPFTASQRLAWACGNSGTSYNRSNQIPNCGGDTINATIVFPNCWDGVNLDSSDHRSHMTYATEANPCPSSHPVRLPQISILLYYPGTSSVAGWHLSADRHGGANMPPGSSLHADWWGGWNDDAMALWTNGCMRAARNCSFGQTGTNRQLARLNGLQRYEGPNVLPIPAGGHPHS